MASCPLNKDFQTEGQGPIIADNPTNSTGGNQIGGSLSFKGALVNGMTLDQHGNGRQGSAKRSLNFEKTAGSSSNGQAQFWQQKAKGKQVDTRSVKHYGKAGGKTSSYIQRKRQYDSLKIDISDPKSATVGALSLPKNTGAIGVVEVQGREDAHIHLSEYKSKMIDAFSTGLVADSSLDSGMIVKESVNNESAGNEGDLPSANLPQGNTHSLSVIDSIGEDGELLDFTGLVDECADLMMEESDNGLLKEFVSAEQISLDPLDKEMRGVLNDSTQVPIDDIMRNDNVVISAPNNIPTGSTIGKKHQELGKNVAKPDGNNSKKNGKANTFLKGVNSRKRNMQNLASPRKKVNGKNGVRIGEGMNADKEDTSNSSDIP